MNLGAGQPAIPPEDVFIAMNCALKDAFASLQSELQNVIHDAFEKLRLTTPTLATSQQRLEHSSTPISDPEIEIVHSHLWKARCKQVALKSTAVTGGVKKRHRSRPGNIGSLATCKHPKRKVSFQRLVDVKADWRFQTLVVPSLLGSTISVQSRLESNCPVSGTGTSIRNLSFLNESCDSVFVAKLGGIAAKNEEGEYYDQKVKLNCGDVKELGELEGVSAKQNVQVPNLGEKVRERHALQVLDEMPQSKGLCIVGIAALTSIRDKGGGLAYYQPLEYVIGVNYAEEDDGAEKSGKDDQVTGSVPFASLDSVVFVETTAHEKETYSHSVVNLDWRYDKAGELPVAFQSIHPKVLFGSTDATGKDEFYKQEFGMVIRSCDLLFGDCEFIDDADQILDVHAHGALVTLIHCALQPRGYPVWSATPVYQKLHEDVGIWKTMSGLTQSVCCDLLGIITAEPKQLIAATGGTSSMKECYNEKELIEPPPCNTAAYPLYDDCYILVLSSNDMLIVWVATVSSCLFHVLLFLMGISYQSTTAVRSVSLPVAIGWNCSVIPSFKFIFINSGPTYSHLNHATLHSAIWSVLMYKDIALLQTHSTIITTIVLGVIPQNAEGYTTAIFLLWSFSMADVVDFPQGNYKLSCLRYFTNPLLSRGNCVGSVTHMHNYFQCVGLALQYESSLAPYCSTLGSPFAVPVLMRNLYPSSPTDAIQLLLSSRVCYKGTNFLDNQIMFAGFSYLGFLELVASECFSCGMEPTNSREIVVYGYIPSVLMDMLAHCGYEELRYSSPSAILAVTTLLFVTLVLCVTDVHVMMALERAHVDNCAGKEKEKLLPPLLTYGVSNAGREQLSLLDLLMKFWDSHAGVKPKSTHECLNLAWISYDLVYSCHNVLRNGGELEYKWETKGYGVIIAHTLHLEFFKNDGCVAVLECKSCDTECIVRDSLILRPEFVAITWHLIKGVKKDLKMRLIAVSCKDMECSNLAPITTESSYFFNTTEVLMITVGRER